MLSFLEYWLISRHILVGELIVFGFIFGPHILKWLIGTIWFFARPMFPYSDAESSWNYSDDDSSQDHQTYWDAYWESYSRHH